MKLLPVLILKDGLKLAVDRFNQEEARSLLCLGTENYDGDGVDNSVSAASERAIAHRLAVHLECWLTRFLTERSAEIASVPVSVDCEYNRHRTGTKTHRICRELVTIVRRARRKARVSPDDERLYVFSIAPDIIVHRRGTDDQNLLAIEMKKSSNPEHPDYDRLKLEQFTRYDGGYEYELGASVEAIDNGDPKGRKLQVSAWYQRGVARSEEQLSNTPSPWLMPKSCSARTKVLPLP